MSQISHDFYLICQYAKKQNLKSQWFCSRMVYMNAQTWFTVQTLNHVSTYIGFITVLHQSHVHKTDKCRNKLFCCCWFFFNDNLCTSKIWYCTLMCKALLNLHIPIEGCTFLKFDPTCVTQILVLTLNIIVWWCPMRCYGQTKPLSRL